MDSGCTLLNLGELSKPATILIEKVSNAIGAVYLPHQIKGIARAEAEAGKIRALAEIEITDLQRRAIVRMVQEESKKQENIEAILAGTLENLNETSKPEKLDDDWISNFFEKCRVISNPEMQSLWSKILSGETNSPGTFSRRTIDLVSTLGKERRRSIHQTLRFRMEYWTNRTNNI